MMQAVVLSLLVPLIAGMGLILARSGGLALQRTLNLLVTAGLLAMAVASMGLVADGSQHVYILGNWQAPFGIVMVLDQLSALMLLLTAILALGALWYAVATGIDARGPHFHPLFQFQLLGINGAFLTGDVFNLFVFFEILLIASYGLLLHGGGRKRTRAGLQYVVINLVGSTLFLFAVGALYGALGTLNLADMAARIQELPEERAGLVAAAGLLLLIVFGVKAAMFPLYLWLPGAYARTSAPVAALFAIMTKVGIYAIIRVHGTLFTDAPGGLVDLAAPWLLVTGLVTMILAAFGVMAARMLRMQVAYLVLASIGTLLIALGLNSQAALAGALYYLFHSTVVTAGLFLLADVIARGRGSVGDRFSPAPAMPNAIFVGSLLFAAAISIAGMPPLSGFFGKVLILHAALNGPLTAWVYAAILVASFMIIVAMARAGTMLFYRTLSTPNDEGEAVSRMALVPVVGLFALSPLMVLFAHPVHEWMMATAQQLAVPADYIHSVLKLEPVGGER
ncbi:MAG: monovalent cation/H+ antiporter subunit D [Halothiobacillaceae bacterium]